MCPSDPIVTVDGRVLTEADIEALADEAEAGYDICVSCHHRVTLQGEPSTSQYWQCTHNCRCLMLGCVLAEEKYGTAP